MAELTLALLIAGSATYYSPGVMAEVYQNRLAWGQVEPCAECVGMVALLDAEHIGRHVWLSFDGGTTRIGPMLVVDCAGAGDRERLRAKQWAVDVDWDTWQRLNLPRRPVQVQVWSVVNAEQTS